MALPLVAKIGLGIAGAGTAYLAGKGSSSEPREPQNATKPDGTPDVTHIQGTDGQGGQYDFSEVEMNTPQSTFKSTNVAYLDDKLRSGTATMMDALVAKQFLGMNLGDYGNQTLDVNMNAKHKITNLNKLYESINNVNANANLYDAVLAAGEGKNTWHDELFRDLHKLLPVLPIGKQNNLYRNLQQAMGWGAAVDAVNGGKPNRLTQEHFLEMYGHNARGEREQTSLMAGAYKQNNIALKKNIDQMAQLLGGYDKVPKEYIQRYERNRQMIKDLSSKDFNYRQFVTKYKLNADDSIKKYATGQSKNYFDGYEDNENSQNNQQWRSVVEQN